MIPFLPTDWKEDLFLIVATALIVGGAFTAQTNLDAEVRSVMRQGTGYFSTATPAEDTIVFQQKQVQKMNDISESSLGIDPVGDERLYCLQMKGNKVTELDFVQDIRKSEQAAISGSCYAEGYNEISGIVHSQPDYTSTLSKEDKSLESPLQYTCIQYDAITESPTGQVGGINCWKVTGYYLDPGFKEIDVVIR